MKSTDLSLLPRPFALSLLVGGIVAWILAFDMEPNQRGPVAQANDIAMDEAARP